MRQDLPLGQFKSRKPDGFSTPVLTTILYKAVGRSGREVFLKVPKHQGDTDEMVTRRAAEAAQSFFAEGNNGNPQRANREGFWLYHNPRIATSLVKFHSIGEVEFFHESCRA